MKYAGGATVDYEGTCTGSIRGKEMPSPTLCKTAILITYTIPEESDSGPYRAVGPGGEANAGQ